MPECPSCGASYSGSSCPYCARTVKDGSDYIHPKTYDSSGNAHRYDEPGYYDQYGNFFPDDESRHQSPPLTDVPTHGYMKGTPESSQNPMLSRLRSYGEEESPLKTTIAILSPKASKRMAQQHDYAHDYRFGYRPPVTAKSVFGCLVTVAVIAAVVIWLILRK